MAGEGLDMPLKNHTLGGLIEEFLADNAKTTLPKTVAWYRGFLDDFAARYPKLNPQEIAPRHLRDWMSLPRKRPWGQSTRRSAVTIIKRLLNWAVENKLLKETPVKDFERPAAVAREHVLSVEDRKLILSFYPEGDPFRDFLTALMESGCRPSEVIKVTAADVDLDAGVWIIEGKTTRRTGKKRCIYLNPNLLALTKRLMAERPTGSLFCNEDGNPWNLSAINSRFRRKKVRKSEPIPSHICAYIYRGTWTTDALENEVPIATVAELLGHTSTAMVSKHYSKLNERRAYLRNAAEQATKKT
jgi:integrase